MANKNQGSDRSSHALRSADFYRLLLLYLLSACLFGCARKRDPQTAYDHAWGTYQHGELVQADKESESGYNDFRALGPDWAWKFTILRGRALYERGRYEEVLRLLSSQGASPPTGELAIRKQWLEGFSYTSLHRFLEADARYAEAERLCEARQYPAACADVQSARGKLEISRGRYAQAQVFFEGVLAFARSAGDRLWEADALLDLSWAANEQTHYDEALDWADTVRRISLERNVPDLTQAALGNMGWAYYKLGDFEKAEEMFLEAEKQARKLGHTADEVKWLTNAGYIYMDVGKAQAAERSFYDSLSLARKINNQEDVINSLIALAFVSEQTEKLDDAKRYADEALKMAQEDQNKRDITYPRLVLGKIAAREHDAATAEAAFHDVENSPDAPVFLKWEAEHSLARLYEDEKHADTAAREYRTALNTFETARAELQHENSRLPFLTNARRIYDDYIQLLVRQGKTDEALQVAEYSRARTLNEGLGLLKKTTSFRPDPLHAPQIARRIGGTVLFYWLGEKQSYLWAITAERTKLFTLPASAEIEARVQRYRKTLTGPIDPLAKADDDGITLYKMLIAPTKTLLAKNAKVFIIPDGWLNTLNFETLLVPEPKLHYWIEDATVADASSLRVLAASRGAKKRGEKLLLIGDAVTANTDYPELRKAADEMESIGKHFPAVQQKVFARDQATAAAYLESKPAQYSYIHFVAHGTASRLSPLDSAIVLSRASAQDDSFKLYARDIIQHPLRADLVTISTCYGAGARAYSGEGLVGLSWAFIRAGAHHVIGALWEVSDASTPQLMETMYGSMRKGEDPEVALRAAKLSLLHSGSAFRKPFYWAPFQLYAGS